MNNPFEYMQSFMNNENFTKNMPNLDFSSTTNVMKNTTEAMNAANKIAAENFQAIFKQGSESLQANSTELYNTLKDAISAGDANQINQCQQKYLQAAIDNNVSSAKEILNMSNKSMMEMIEILHNGFKETADNKTTPKTKK